MKSSGSEKQGGKEEGNSDAELRVVMAAQQEARDPCIPSALSLTKTKLAPHLSF